MTTKRMFIFLATVFFCVNAVAYACTTFTLNDDGHVVYGRNLDWHVGSGLIMVNHRDIAKQALVIPMSEREVKPASWVSQYGSVTFNGLAREFPTGGINEAGLVVDVMWLDKTQYPAPDARPELHVLQWTQYMLDTCKSVDEVIAANAKVRISQDCKIPQHFLVADPSGKTAIIEYLDGKQVVHIGASLPHTCLTNNTYAESTRYAKQHKSLGGDKAIQQDQSSLNRFVRAAKGVKEFPPQKKNPIAYAFGILHNVNAGYEQDQHSTMWSIVYDLTAMKIHYRTHKNRETRVIDVSKIEYQNNQPVRVWDIQNTWEGDITAKSQPYTTALNREIIIKHVNHPSIKKNIGDFSPLIDPLTVYPEKFTRKK